MYLQNRTYLEKSVEPVFPSLNTLIESINSQQSCFLINNDGKAVVNIAFHENEGPVRVVVRRSNYRQTYQLFSQKTKKTMSCESLIEFNGCYILENIPSIKSYQMQPAIINYLIGGVVHRHIPDVLVELKNHTKFFIEFKAETKLDDEVLIARTEVLGNNLPSHGYGYLVVCDAQVSGIHLSNAKQLFHSQKNKIPKVVLMEIKNQFDISPTIVFRNLIKILRKESQIRNHLYQLMQEGVIGYESDQLITEHSEIYWFGSVK